MTMVFFSLRPTCLWCLFW